MSVYFRKWAVVEVEVQRVVVPARVAFRAGWPPAKDAFAARRHLRQLDRQVLRREAEAVARGSH